MIFRATDHGDPPLSDEENVTFTVTEDGTPPLADSESITITAVDRYSSPMPSTTWRDGRHFRFVRLKEGRVQIGEVLGDGPATVEGAPYAIVTGKFHSISVEVGSDGLVSVLLDGEPAIFRRFADAPAGGWASGRIIPGSLWTTS